MKLPLTPRRREHEVTASPQQQRAAGVEYQAGGWAIAAFHNTLVQGTRRGAPPAVSAGSVI